MKKLNIIGQRIAATKVQFVKIELFDNPEESVEFYTATDGMGNFALGNDNSIWWADKSNKNVLEDRELDGDPTKLYKGKPLLQVIKFNGKLGVWDTNTLKLKEGPYKNMDQLIEDIYENEVLRSDIKYLDFENE